jgi:hypothetical protein
VDESPEVEVEPRPFKDELDFTAWLILRGGLNVREFLALDLASIEGHLVVKAITRAEEIRVDELREFARAITGSKGGGS